MKKSILTLVLFSNFASVMGFACDNYLHANDPDHPKINFNSSGRIEDVKDKYLELIRRYTDEGGILDKLGIANPYHEYSFVSSRDIATLASLGRHPIPHAHDGNIVLTQLFASLGVMEFVTPASFGGACPGSRSFYNDTTSWAEQFSILFHVFGHTDFSENSLFSKIRALDGEADSITKSLELAQKMNEWMKEYGSDEVSLFYQYLLSINFDQDVLKGSFQHPTEFKFDKNNRKPTHPVAPTNNSLQFLVENMPAETPDWKIEMIRLFEQVNRQTVYVIQTKIMNEGWATLMMEILAYHGGENSHHEIFSYSKLLSGVAVPDLSNPYFLGREAWRSVRRRFNNRPDIKTLDVFEQDKRFIAHAHQVMREYMDDFNFLKFALDEQWVYQNKLYLKRPAQHHEWNHNLPPSKKQEDDYQWVVTSVDPKEVVKKVVETSGADKRFSFPDVRLKDVYALGNNSVLYEHMPYEGIPLVLEQAVMKTFVLTKIHNKQVSLLTIMKDERLPGHDGPEDDDMFFMPKIPMPPVKLAPVKIRIDVTPDGKVKVYRLADVEIVEDTRQVHLFDELATEQQKKHYFDMKDDEELEADEVVDVLDENLSKHLQDVVEFYKEDQRMSMSPALFEKEFPEIRQVIQGIVDTAIKGPISSISGAPTAPDAVLEYTRLVTKRMAKTLEGLKNGTVKGKVTGQGIQVRIMPIIPEWRHDGKAIEEMVNGAVPSPIDSLTSTFALSSNDPRLAAVPFRFAYNGGMPEYFDRFVDADGKIEEVINQKRSKEILKVVSDFKYSKELSPRFNEIEKYLLDVEAYSNNVIALSEKETAITGTEATTLMGRDTSIGSGSGKPGDRNWGPNPNGGQGEGEGDEPGGKKPGKNPVPPGYVNIPLDQWGQYLNVKLPNLRNKKGPSKMTKTKLRGVVNKPNGQQVLNPMMKDAMVVGKLKLEEMGRPDLADDPVECIYEGLKHMTNDNIYVRARKIDKKPDMRAVVFLPMDMSGSMWGWKQDAAKEFMFNLRAALKAKYKDIEFVYVAFDTQAHIFKEKDVDKFFKVRLGGGTDYSMGYETCAKELKANYPESQYDRYIFGIGDSEDSASQIDKIKRIVKDTEYSGYVHLGVRGGFGEDFRAAFEGLSKSDEFFGYAEISTEFGKNRSLAIKAIYDLLKQSEKK
ncbi:MAG: SpoVR family protein [Bacteriovoracaceae bacterium]|nr:SpoVR family protein [Bacteriovoracaceae bacterium]